MISLAECVSILDEREDSAAFSHFKSLASVVEKLKKEGGYRATQSFKKDGIDVYFEWTDKVWLIVAVQLYPKKASRFLPYGGEITPSVFLQDGRQALVAALGVPSSSGGDGSVGQFGIINRIWERWDYAGYSLRFDYENDGATVYIAHVQRPRDVQEFEKRRASQKPGG